MRAMKSGKGLGTRPNCEHMVGIQRENDAHPQLMWNDKLHRPCPPFQVFVHPHKAASVHMQPTERRPTCSIQM